MNKIFIIIFAILLLSSCATKDIRPLHFEQNVHSAQMQLKAKKIIQKVIKRYDPKNHWKDFEVADVIYSDHWDAFFPKLYNAPYQDDIKIKYSFLLNTYNSQIEFQEGKRKGEIWGIQNWATYYKKPKEQLFFRRHFKTKFHLAARQFFFELPFNLKNFPIVTYLGKETLNNQLYHKIFLSNSENLDLRNDQFIAYINTENLNLEILYYTIRELGRSFSGAAHFLDLKKIQDIYFPIRTIIGWMPGGNSTVHQFKISKLHLEMPSHQNQIKFYPDRSKKEDYFFYFSL